MPGFDVFLSHNSNDKPTVRALKQALAERGFKCWLDEKELRPGLPWQDLLEQGIKDCGSMAVCVAADGLGPWQEEEMRAALHLAVKDGCPIIPVLLPGAPSKPELPLFLVNRTWVDLRRGLDGEGIAKLIWGITGKPPGEGVTAPPDAPGGDEVPTPSDTLFLDEIFERLHTYPTLILLAQEDREWCSNSSLKVLRESAQRRFGMDQTLHLIPPPNTDASQAEFFHTLGRRAGMDPPAESALAFEDYLDQRLISGERLFLLVAGLSKCSDAGRRRLASGLRGLSDAHDDALRMVLVGGEGLAELKYAQGDLSLLSYAEPLDWPELNTGDLIALARQIRPPLNLTPEEAWTILQATGGHPRLIQEALWCRTKGTLIDTCIRELASSKQIEAQFVALTQDAKNAQRIADWLRQDELGPYCGWILDPLLRRLYWKNLLRTEGPTGAERLVWRCPAIIDAGRRVLGWR